MEEMPVGNPGRGGLGSWWTDEGVAKIGSGEDGELETLEGGGG